MFGGHVSRAVFLAFSSRGIVAKAPFHTVSTRGCAFLVHEVLVPFRALQIRVPSSLVLFCCCFWAVVWCQPIFLPCQSLRASADAFLCRRRVGFLNSTLRRVWARWPRTSGCIGKRCNLKKTWNILPPSLSVLFLKEAPKCVAILQHRLFFGLRDGNGLACFLLPPPATPGTARSRPPCFEQRACLFLVSPARQGRRPVVTTADSSCCLLPPPPPPLKDVGQA